MSIVDVSEIMENAQKYMGLGLVNLAKKELEKVARENILPGQIGAYESLYGRASEFAARRAEYFGKAGIDY